MNKRILIVDDTKSIHEDFKKILAPENAAASDLASARAAFFGKRDSDDECLPKGPPRSYDLAFAFQGQEGASQVRKAKEQGDPFAIAFVDVRMPPGWDGVQTIKEMWRIDPELHCVICTAYSDYSWDETVEELGYTDKLLILKKPFDPTEIRQVASAFTAKWNAANRERDAMAVISQKEVEARAYASSLETLNKALATAKASADQMSIMKSDFMTRLTSEVSTHLNAILDRLVEDGRTEGLDDALDRSQRLLETIDKVIDFTQVEAGTMVIENGPCDVREVLDDLDESFRARADEKGLALEFRISSTVPDCVWTDAGRLHQVLGYLVDNGIRYTDEGRVHVSVGTEPAESWDRTRLRIDVTDTGRGIKQERMGRVFEPFSSRRKDELAEGSGLGLTVAKQIARLLGGDVHFDSLPGEGCTFTLKLEVRRGDHSPSSSASGS
ncbi:MAG: hybrid sensor histidine kinase/response regulator [Planctomycetota bacterium]